jgi:hypothetical protein
MSQVSMFLGKQVGRVTDPSDMSQDNVQKEDSIANSIFTDIEVSETFGGHGVGPVNATLVVIEQG